MSLFDRFKKKKTEVSKPLPANPSVVKKVELKRIDYHPKILLAWSQSISGNQDISAWLNENGYPELVIAAAAIRLKGEARTWLMDNGFAHIMAMIHASEGDAKAQKWLLKYKFDLLYHIAMAVEHQNESWIWLKQNATPDIFILTQEIKKVKDKIEENHNDIHSFRRD